jgi:crotonobetainyl-CoA:carnitine CoA-transferase CaiB-like acyl-CoA transferase
MNAQVAAPLSGYRVVEFAGYIAGPGVGGVLADLGADVIKVESAVGDAARHMGPYGDAIWANCNRGKRSIVLDLQTHEGREAAFVSKICARERCSDSASILPRSAIATSGSCTFP